MRRRTAYLTFVLGLGLLAAPLTGDAQQAGKVHRIGFLWPGGAPPPEGAEGTGNEWPRSFRQGLRDLGYVQGQNIILESRLAEGSADRLRDFAAELTRLDVDVIVAVSSARRVIASGAMLAATSAGSDALLMEVRRED